MVDASLESPRVAAGDLAALLPANLDGMAVSVIEPLRCVALRHLPGGLSALEPALAGAGLPAQPAPGCLVGIDPWLLWRSPTEILLIATAATVADKVVTALAPGNHMLACAVDLSAGCIAVQLHGAEPLVDAMLSRLIDASAIPLVPGQGTRARLADIPVSVLRVAEDTAWLLADRSHGQYLKQWMVRGMVATNRDGLAGRQAGSQGAQSPRVVPVSRVDAASAPCRSSLDPTHMSRPSAARGWHPR